MRKEERCGVCFFVVPQMGWRGKRAGFWQTLSFPTSVRLHFSADAYFGDVRSCLFENVFLAGRRRGASPDYFFVSCLKVKKISTSLMNNQRPL